MPVYSMTGYATVFTASPGGAQAGPASGGVTVELRSVNSRFLDLAFRLPDDLRSLEPVLRELLAAAFRRGKIELRIGTQREAESAWPQPQPEQLARLTRLEDAVQSWLPRAAGLSVHEVLQWCRNATPGERLDDAALAAARDGIESLRAARRREGERLVVALRERTSRLRALAAQAEPLVPAVVQRQQQRFLERWNEALGMAKAGAGVPAEALHERALGEAAAYAIRIDVAEELSRLVSHLDEIERLLDGGGEIGKRLDFQIQELHREANTLGSKASALELTQISVEMKVLIEQMREQVQNIE
jgi:uncharacterized protein (TIGR00255 family)